MIYNQLNANLMIGRCVSESYTHFFSLLNQIYSPIVLCVSHIRKDFSVINFVTNSAEIISECYAIPIDAGANFDSFFYGLLSNPPPPPPSKTHPITSTTTIQLTMFRKTVAVYRER
jgi:hypothetical protein